VTEYTKPSSSNPDSSKDTKTSKSIYLTELTSFAVLQNIALNSFKQFPMVPLVLMNIAAQGVGELSRMQKEAWDLTLGQSAGSLESGKEALSNEVGAAVMQSGLEMLMQAQKQFWNILSNPTGQPAEAPGTQNTVDKPSEVTKPPQK